MKRNPFKVKKPKKSGKNWLVCEPEIASIFENGTAGFSPAPQPEWNYTQWNKEQREKKGLK